MAKSNCQTLDAVLFSMSWHPLELMRIIFLVLVMGMVIAGLTTQARHRKPGEWTLVWALLIFLAWALLGFGGLRSR